MDRTKIVACLSACLLAACSGPARIVVGSKNFSEQVLLGEILAQQIERRLGVRVDRKLSLGGTLVAQGALVNGSIDLYPEYTGTALTAILKQQPLQDSGAVLGAVRAAYEEKWKLRWLAPLGFNNTFAMMVRGETARGAKLETLSDAARSRAWRMGVGYEFKQRPDGLDGLLASYGLRTDGDPVTMDLGLLYKALETRKVDMIAANSTDGQASVLDITILKDDRHYFPPYDCAVVVREDTLGRFPQLREALEQLSGKLSDPVMRKLNYAVDGEHRSPAQVASEFLRTTFGGS
ncbi:MAG TPA: glycine betaine ABC transporter substrate-binding protein [Bryobacteraceae bacterium]|jgi:osmoprotectant transport system substrate-binding protein|nr:glycine betaine ABC transporter substrate-binding protein [Bryobacteraceae bacterium]